MKQPLSSQAFAEGFEAITGRKPTQRDFEQYQAAQSGRRPGATTQDQVGAIARPVASLGGMYLGGQLMGGAATTGATAGTAAATGATAGTAATTGATAGTAATGATAATGTGIGAAALPVAGGIAGAYGLYDLSQNVDDMSRGRGAAQGAASGAALGASIGSVVPGVGTVIGGAIGGLAGGTYGAFAPRGKDVFQERRDSIRGNMQELGLMTPDYMLNGVDIGQDGGFRFDDGRKIYEIQAGQESGVNPGFDEMTGNVVGALNPLGYLIGGQSEGPTSGYSTGMLYNALKEGGDEGITESEIMGLYDQAGGYQPIFDAIGGAVNNGQLDLETGQAYQNALNALYKKDAYAEMNNEDRLKQLGAILG
jgi:hypothetical protein